MSYWLLGNGVTPLQVIHVSDELPHASAIETGIPAPEPFFQSAKGTRPEDESADDEGWNPDQTRQDDPDCSDRNEHHADLRGQILDFPNL